MFLLLLKTLIIFQTQDSIQAMSMRTEEKDREKYKLLKIVYRSLISDHVTAQKELKIMAIKKKFTSNLAFLLITPQISHLICRQISPLDMSTDISQYNETYSFMVVIISR